VGGGGCGWDAAMGRCSEGEQVVVEPTTWA
jgi:hypothetical protein